MLPKAFDYPYTIKRSSRARHVRLVVSSDGLVVVVPEKFRSELDLPSILESKRNWIVKAFEKLQKKKSSSEGGFSGRGFSEGSSGLPKSVALQAIGGLWNVEMVYLERERLQEGQGTIFITSDFNEKEAIFALRRWLLQKARLHLPPLLRELANRHGFCFMNVAVKEQKSIWGSCSSKGNINLNARLLFLPFELVNHVMLHELCHLKEMNHSGAFYEVLSRLDSETNRLSSELRLAWDKIPGWAL